jgi:hypothetical protein
MAFLEMSGEYVFPDNGGTGGYGAQNWNVRGRIFCLGDAGGLIREATVPRAI